MTKKIDTNDSDSFHDIQEQHSDILTLMQAFEIETIEVSYDGYDGDTYVDTPLLYNAKKNLLDGEEFETLKNWATDLCSDLLDCVVPDYNEESEGGRGSLVIKAKTGVMTLKHQDLDLIKLKPTKKEYDLSIPGVGASATQALETYLGSLRRCGVDFVAGAYDGTNNDGYWTGPHLYAGKLKALCKIARDGEIGDPVRGWNKDVSPVAGKALNILDHLSPVFTRVRVDLAPGFDDAEGSSGFLILDVFNQKLIHEHANYSRDGKIQTLKFDAPAAPVKSSPRPRA